MISAFCPHLVQVRLFLSAFCPHLSADKMLFYLPWLHVYVSVVQKDSDLKAAPQRVDTKRPLTSVSIDKTQFIYIEYSYTDLLKMKPYEGQVKSVSNQPLV